MTMDSSQVAGVPLRSDADLQEVNEEIYKHSLELAVVNKTLSLLRKLYHISLSTFDTATLAEKIAETIRVDLNMEAVGIFLFNAEHDALIPCKFSKSERLIATMAEQGVLFSEATITAVSSNPFLKAVVHGQEPSITKNIGDIWGESIDPAKLREISLKSHLKNIVLHPLVVQYELIGVLLLGLNREYMTLSEYETEAIRSLVDVVSVGVDKTLLYEKIKSANENLRKLDVAKSEFISIASHQLRTPLTAIKGFISLILEGTYGPPPPKIEDALNKVYASNERLIQLVEDLLNLSRIESGRLEYKIEPAHIEDLLNELYATFQIITKKKGLELNLRLPATPLPTVSVDFFKLREVISNVIDNAIKYTKEGSVTIKAGLTEDQTKVRVSVKDTGIGVPLDEMGNLFQKFSRGKDTTRLHANGTGLGLYVGKQMLEAMGGRVWVESEGEGKGSTFFVEVNVG